MIISAAESKLAVEQSIGSKQYLEQDNQLRSSIMDHQHDQCDDGSNTTISKMREHMNSDMHHTYELGFRQVSQIPQIEIQQQWKVGHLAALELWDQESIQYNHAVLNSEIRANRLFISVSFLMLYKSPVLERIYALTYLFFSSSNKSLELSHFLWFLWRCEPLLLYFLSSSVVQYTD